MYKVVEIACKLQKGALSSLRMLFEQLQHSTGAPFMCNLEFLCSNPHNLCIYEDERGREDEGEGMMGEGRGRG